MRKYLIAGLVSSVCIPALTSSAMADDDARFTWEAEIELGFESLYDSNVPANEGDVAYASGEFAAEFALSETVSVFGGLTFEDVTGNSDYGYYLHELGLQFAIGGATIQVGKVSPTFGTTWDSAAGFFAASLAEDYELAEQLGVLAEVAFAGDNTLSFGVFFADNSTLSESAGFNRGRNTTAAGGAGNTGELNNVALQWSKELGDTYFHFGARYLSAGLGDVSDETGFVAGAGHSFGTLPLDIFAEVASFDGFGGTADDATYATLNAAWTFGASTTLSGTFARRDITSAGVTDLFSISLEKEFKNGITIGGGLAWVDDAGTKDQLFGVNVVIPLGG